jgi:hypothetical protein
MSIMLEHADDQFVPGRGRQVHREIVEVSEEAENQQKDGESQTDKEWRQ